MTRVRLCCFLSVFAAVVVGPVSAHGNRFLQGTFSHDTGTDQLIHFSVAEDGRVTVVNRAVVHLSGDLAGAVHAFPVIRVELSSSIAQLSGVLVFVGTLRGNAIVLEGSVALRIDQANPSDGIRGVYDFRRDGGPLLFVSGGVDGATVSGSYRGTGRRIGETGNGK